MKKYVYSEKILRINNKKFKAIFPKNHSVIKALIFEIINENANDTWANIPDYHTFCAIMKKDSNKWEILSDNKKSSDFTIGKTRPGTTSGIYDILYDLEKENIKRQIDKNSEISELKSRIKRDSKRLKELIN